MARGVASMICDVRRASGYFLFGGVREHGGAALASGYKVHNSERRGVMPDVQYFRRESGRTLPDCGLDDRHPDLAVEVASLSSRGFDRVTKLAWYASIGVPEYWIVDAEAHTIERFVLAERRLVLDAVATADATFRLASFPGLAIPLVELSGRRPRRIDTPGSAAPPVAVEKARPSAAISIRGLVCRRGAEESPIKPHSGRRRADSDDKGSQHEKQKGARQLAVLALTVGQSVDIKLNENRVRRRRPGGAEPARRTRDTRGFGGEPTMAAAGRQIRIVTSIAAIAVAAMLEGLQVASLAEAAGPLIAGGGSKASDCVAQLLSEQATAESFTRRRLRCADGGGCDADRKADDRCAFSVAICLNFPDPERPTCLPSDVVAFEVLQQGVDPERAALQTAVTSVGLPTAATVCSEAVRVTVPVRVAKATKGVGRKVVRTRARTGSGITDSDRIVLLCDPAGSPAANRSPVVRAVASPTNGRVPLTVAFSATATDPDGDALSLQWNFGDGATASGSAASHTYQSPGPFGGRVTATDDKGATATAAFTVVVTDRLGVQHANRYPTRLAEGPDGKLYVSDPRANAVFVYDADLQLTGELKGLARPLGVAVDAQGNVFVGNDGRDNVEVYDSFGVLRLVVGNGAIGMPSDLVLDRERQLYVADSPSDTVKVYDASGAWVRNIGQPGDGPGDLRFPAALALGYRSGGGPEVAELYVADQGHSRVEVFDLQGSFLRAYGAAVPAFSSSWEGLFVRLQSLALDAHGRLHAADAYLNRVQILDAVTGGFLDSYGGFGTGAGELNLPLDILVSGTGRVLVANAENHRVEAVYTVP